MINKKNSKKSEKAISLFEILILTIGIVAFAYFVGNEFGIVSASTPGGGTSGTTCSPGQARQIACKNPCTDTVGGVTYKHTCSDGKCAEYCLPSGQWSGECACLNPAYDHREVYNPTETDTTTGTKTEQTGGGIGETAGILAASQLSNIFSPVSNPGAALTQQITQATTQAAKGALTNTGIPIVDNTWGSLLNIAAQAAIAVGLYFATKTIAEFFNLNPQFADQLAWSISLGYGIGAVLGATLSSFGVGGVLGGGVVIGAGITIPYLGLIGLAIGVLGCLLGAFCQEAKYTAYIYTCNAWQPETGGKDCEKCNKGQFPCTEYKCQSLGENCELLNKGTKDELCVWNNRNDIAPPIIETWDGPLGDKFEYTPDSARLPPDKGIIIKYKDSTDGCVPPFTTLSYGISLDKPGKCKMDVNVRADSYDEMIIPISSGIYKYNHTLTSLFTSAGENGVPEGGNYEVFLRCESKNGFSNEGTFVFKYCVQSSPDTTAPEIKLTDPLNGMPVKYGQTSIDVNVYVNKPSDCRWSHTDQDYEAMAGTMSCGSGISEVNANMLYTCSATLDSLKDETENKFYFRCNSYPGADTDDDPNTNRYSNAESYVYKLIGTRPLVLDTVGPNETIKDATESVQVTLTAHTSAGYKNGEAKCYFKGASEEDNNYVLFSNTGSFDSSQDLWLNAGDYGYSIRCCDLGGNCDAKTTEFTVETDFESPLIIRAYNEENKLKLITNEKAQCVYDITDCNYNFDDGVQLVTADNLAHTTDWNTNNNFYIKCKDEFGNQPAPNECSIIIRPSNF